MKWKAFFIIFKRVSFSKNCPRPESAPLRSQADFFFSCSDWVSHYDPNFLKIVCCQSMGYCTWRILSTWINLKEKQDTGSRKTVLANFVEFIYTTSGILIEEFYSWFADNIHIVNQMCMRMLNHYVWHTLNIFILLLLLMFLWPRCK